MTFKSALWRPIAIVLSLLNLGAAGFAAVGGEPVHAGVHVALALAFAAWAQRLREQPAAREIERDDRLDVLEAEVSDLQRELSQTRESLNFTEQLLAQKQEARRVEQQRELPEKPD